MKILYVTDHRQIARASGGFISDYLNDLTFFGLKELYGDDVIDSTPIISLYKNPLLVNSIRKRICQGISIKGLLTSLMEL